MKRFVIRNINDGVLYWNNEDGYGGFETAQIFTEEESNKLNLPMEGYWLEYEQAEFEDLLDRVADQIEMDIFEGDRTAFFELLRYVPKENLEAYLPEKDL